MIFRNDDLCYGSDIKKYREIQAIFNSFNIKEHYSTVPFGQNIYDGNPFEKPLNELEAKLGNNFIFQDRAVDDFIKESLNNGHYITLHGWLHTMIVRYSYKEQLEYIKQGKDLLENQYGVKIEYFVPPFNNYNDDTVKVCNQLNLKILGANNNQLEWLVKSGEGFKNKDYCWYHAWRFTKPDELKSYLCQHLNNQPPS